MKSRSKAIVLSLPPLAKHSNGYQKAKWYRKMKWPLRSLVHMKLIRRCSFFTPTSHAEMPQGDQVFLPAPFVSLENARSKLPKVSQWSSNSAQLWHSQFGKKTGHQKTWKLQPTKPFSSSANDLKRNRWVTSLKLVGDNPWDMIENQQMHFKPALYRYIAQSKRPSSRHCCRHPDSTGSLQPPRRRMEKSAKNGE